MRVPLCDAEAEANEREMPSPAKDAKQRCGESTAPPASPRLLEEQEEEVDACHAHGSTGDK